MRFTLTAGQCHDSPHAEALIAGYSTQAVIADKGYNSALLINLIKANGTEAAVPPRTNRKLQREYDKRLYKERRLVEYFINKIKHYRRVFTRYEKLSKSYLGFLSFVSALVWLH